MSIAIADHSTRVVLKREHGAIDRGARVGWSHTPTLHICHAPEDAAHE